MLFIDCSTTEIPCENAPLRGRSTFLYHLPYELYKLGWSVAVLSNIEANATSMGVNWISAKDAGPVLTRSWQSVVILRGLRDGWPEIQAGKRIFCPRDLPHAALVPDTRVIDSLYGTVYLSDYARDVWQSYYPSLDGVYDLTIPNGVNSSIFYPRHSDIPINERSLIFFSNPNRGMSYLPILKEGVSKKLGREIGVVCLSDHDILHPGECPQADFGPMIEACHEAGVIMLKPCSQELLSDILSTCSLALLPSSYPEICSNAMLQSMAMGIPVVTSKKLGSAEQFIPRDSLVTHLPLDGEVYLKEFVLKCASLIEDSFLYKKVSIASQRRVLPWKDIARLWEKMI